MTSPFCATTACDVAGHGGVVVGDAGPLEPLVGQRPERVAGLDGDRRRCEVPVGAATKSGGARGAP